MDELTSGEFEVFEIPVTLGCDGSKFLVLLSASIGVLTVMSDRRREVNMVKRTVGFNWTASGVSTAVWRGVPVRDVLQACGLREPPAGERWYVQS